MDELLSENLIQQPHSFLFSTVTSRRRKGLAAGAPNTHARPGRRLRVHRGLRAGLGAAAAGRTHERRALRVGPPAAATGRATSIMRRPEAASSRVRATRYMPVGPATSCASQLSACGSSVA